ncbi:Polycystic kidney disease [Chamberlinius hualienensis]
MEENINLDEMEEISSYRETENSRVNFVSDESRGNVGYFEAFRHRYLRSTVFQLVVFILFLAVLSCVTFGTTSTARFHMTEAIKAAFLNKAFGRGIVFHDISSVRDIWMFLEEVTIPQLFPLSDDYDYNANFSSKYVLDGNILLGIPRLKQLRVRNDSCRVHDDFRAFVSVCYNAYSEDVEDRLNFGYQNGTAWVYSTDEALNSLSFWGQISVYNGGGSYEDLGAHSQEPFAQLQFLMSNKWLDIATRVVVLDFTLYNVNVNLFSIVKYILLFSDIIIIYFKN